jgi:hypothetical protein
MGPRAIRSRLGAVVFALAGAVTQALAQGGPPVGAPMPRVARPIIVLESYVGQRPANAGDIMAPLLDELAQREFVVRPAAVLDRIGGRAPRPGVLDKAQTAAEITQPAEAGYAAYTRGRFAEAEAALTLALDKAHRNPALLVLDTNNLNAAFKILVGISLSQAKRGDASGSAATMAELIRMFRNQPITRIDYGPDAEQFYRAVWKQVRTMGRGQLSITVDNDQAVIFVDGQLRGLSKLTLVDLIPGIYRVFIQVPPSAGRQYEIEVNAGHATTLRVDWELDSTLWLTDSWSGFVFATEADRARQAGFAGKLARCWGGGDLLAVVGMVQLQHKPGVMGSLYDAAGNVVRSAMVTLEGADELKLRSLARFLAGGLAGRGVTVVQDTAPGPGVPPAVVSSSPLVPQLVVAAGAVALVAGGILSAVDQDPKVSAPYLYRNTAPAGIAVGSVGVAMMSVGIWLWVARNGRLSAPTLAVGHSSGFVGWAGEL